MVAARSVAIAVAAHKPYRMPDDPAYIPVHVGAALNPDVCPDWAQDNEGESISELNPTYCELTALYWLWKNVNADVKGLVHYRRLLGSADRARRKAKDPYDRLATGEELYSLAKRHGVVVARRRNYVIETVGDHYAHTHDVEQLNVCRDVLTVMCPEYVSSWDARLRARGAHMFNMFVMQSEIMNAYCSWLFPILGEAARRIDFSNMTSFEARWPGRVSELLLDPWLSVHGIEPVELPVVSPEPVDWVAKGRGFLAAKFLGKKYEQSF